MDSEIDALRRFAAILALAQDSSDSSNDSDSSSNGSEILKPDVKHFLEAAKDGDRSGCQKFVKEGGDPNVRGSKKLTALHLAAHEGQLGVIRELLSLGAAIDATDKDGDTPLVMALLNRQEEAIDLLIELGADVRHANDQGLTASDIALLKRNMTILQILESKAHCVNFESEVHHVTLATAAQDGNTRVIEFWLTNHPNPRACDQKFGQDRTMAFIAALNGHLDVMQLLDSKGANFELTDENKHTPMFCAAQNDHFDVVQFLLEKGCNVNHVSGTRRTPIFSAVLNGHDDIVELMIDHDANVNHADEDGTTPLACAIVKGFMPIFQMLAGAGADPNHLDGDGDDMTMLAARAKSLEMLKVLKQRGASMIQVNEKNGETALLIASQVGPSEVIEFLLEEGSDKNHRNRRGVSPILRAVYNNLIDVAKILATAGADLDIASNDDDTPILIAAQQNNMELVRFLHSRKCKLGSVNNNGITMAWFAARNGNLELLKFLKEAGAPMDVPDVNGSTPLMVAVEVSSPEVVKFLIRCGCSLTKKNNRGQTAEEIARNSKKGSMIEAFGPPKSQVSTASSSVYSSDGSEKRSCCFPRIRKPKPQRRSSAARVAPAVLDASFSKWDFLRDEKGSKQSIGEGAFGKVYKAITDKQQFVAVKVIKMGGMSLPSVMSTLTREMQGVEILRRIRHENIVEFLKCEVSSSGDFCIFTELIAGLSLFDLMQRQQKPIDEDGILKFSRQICLALNFLHRRKPAVLHRDIKCSNIMLTYQGAIKLIDFGLAKEIMTSVVAVASDQCGTICFMAPELFDDSSNTGRVTYTAKSDVWALGCTVFEMATMRPPNTQRSPAELIKAITSKPMPSLPSSFSELFRGFYDLCVVKEPEKRADTDALMQHEFISKMV